jgi:hypothetical protein
LDPLIPLGRFQTSKDAPFYGAFFISGAAFGFGFKAKPANRYQETYGMLSLSSTSHAVVSPIQRVHFVTQTHR